MRKSKKEITICIIIVMIVTMIYRPLKAKGANNQCSVMEDYYFVEAINVVANDDGTYTLTKRETSNDTTFKTPSGTFVDISIGNPRNFTVTDCEKYYSNYEQRRAEGVEPDEAYCHEGTCTNSGNGQRRIDYNDAVKQSSCSKMVNNQINYNDVDIKINEQVEGKNEVSVTIDREYIVTAEQKENFYTDANGDMWLFQPVAVTVEMTYATDSECKNKPETPIVCAANGSDSYTFSGCGGSSHSATITAILTTDDYQSSYNTSFSDEAISARYCSSWNVKEYATAQANFTQNGRLSVFLDNEKYSGGGVGFSFNYSTQATWNYCGDDPGPKCYKKIHYPKCRDDGYSFNSTNGKCEKEEKYWEDEHICIGGWKNGVCQEWQGGTETRIVSNSNYGCENTILTGTSKERCTAGKAEEEIYKKAGEKLKSISGPEAESYDSNVVSTNRISLADNNAGKTSVSSPSGGSWPVGTSRYGSLSFSVNQACINIYNPFDVVYETSGECGENRIDGGNRYYIPLKWPESNLFKFWGSSNGVSIIKGMNWSLSFECGVNCKQKIYKEDKGYKFIYRPIDLLNPFPQTVNPNRKIGSNWIYFMNHNEAIELEMNRKNLEYEKVLTKEDINHIKNNINNSSYATLETITPQGKSKILPDMGIEIKLPNSYNGLGKCTEECW